MEGKNEEEGIVGEVVLELGVIQEKEMIQGFHHSIRTISSKVECHHLRYYELEFIKLIRQILHGIICGDNQIDLHSNVNLIFSAGYDSIDRYLCQWNVVQFENLKKKFYPHHE